MNTGSLWPDTLRSYVERARPILIEIARQETVITYGELLDRMGGGPGRRYIGEVIGQISEEEMATGHPKLSAVVVRSDSRRVGGGFFGLPDTPQAIIRSSPEEWQDPFLSAADYEYWQDQLQEVYRYWREHGL